MDPTLRARLSALATDEEGRLCRMGVPFSGLAYCVADEGIVCEIKVVEKGTVIGPSSDWLDVGRGRRLDRASLDLADDYGPLVWRGTPVDGVVYFFDTRGVCLVEEAYEAGQPTDAARREWYASGAPKALLRGSEGSAWFEDGRLRNRRGDGRTLLNLVVRQDGRLGGIVLQDQSLFDVATVRPMVLSDDVMLLGRGIDARLLGMLLDETELGAVPRLRLIETAIGPQDVGVLASLPGLGELWLAKNPSLSPHDADVLRARRPDCVVHYEEPMR
jgi:hypothetical protein